jgi:hypothetical protein
MDASPHIRGERERLVTFLRNVIDAAARSSQPGGPVIVRLNAAVRMPRLECLTRGPIERRSK